MNDSEKKELIKRLILSSPPGEVNEVFNDVRALIEDDNLFLSAVLQPLAQYNAENLITVDMPNSDSSHKVCIKLAYIINYGFYIKFKVYLYM